MCTESILVSLVTRTKLIGGKYYTVKILKSYFCFWMYYAMCMTLKILCQAENKGAGEHGFCVGHERN